MVGVKCTESIKRGWFLNRKTLRVDIGDYEYGKSGRVKAFKLTSYINGKSFETYKYTVPRFTKHLKPSSIKISVYNETNLCVKDGDEDLLAIIYSDGFIDIL